MSAEIRESFDHYTCSNAPEMGWTSQVPILSYGSPLAFQTYTPGRTGGQAFYPIATASASIALPSGNQPTVIAGFAFNNQAGYSYRNLFSFDNLGVAQLVVALNANGGFDVGLSNGTATQANVLIATLLGRTANALYGSTGWTHVELKATASSSSGGSLTLRCNSVAVLTLTGINTVLSGAASSYAVFTFIGGGGTALPGAMTVAFDDLYINNGLGAAHNSFEGDIKILCFWPTANGTYAQWTPLTGTNFSEVNETLVDGDTSYVSTPTVGNKDTYTFPAFTLPTGGAIVDVQTVAITRKDDAGAHTVAAMVRSPGGGGGTDYVGAAAPVMNSYNGIRTIWAVDPNTGAPWTVAGLNAAEFGEELIS